MPGDQHLPGASPKRNRQYEHIKEDYLESGKSEEEAKELAARTVNKQRSEHGETKKSKWQVVALGELTQPGGVGATQEYNPVVDGPNPDGPSFQDNAGNSPEQEQALQTWVNMAIDMINRGQEEQAIVAQLAHDGCPDPQEVVERAKLQPNKSPVDNELGQDPFDAPTPNDDPAAGGQMQGLSQQPPVTTAGSRVRIAGSTMTGTVQDAWLDLWGQGTVKIALDEGGSVSVAPTAVEGIDETPRQPLSEIQQFINSLPKVEPTRPNIEARLTNLELVRRAVRSTISKVGFSDQVKLQTIDREAAAETQALREWLSENLTAEVVTQKYRYNALGAAVADSNLVPHYAGNPREAGAIWASESPWIEGFADEADLRFAAVHYAENHNMTGEQFNAFLKSAEEYVQEHRHVRTEEFDADPDYDGVADAEQLFVR